MLRVLAGYFRRRYSPQRAAATKPALSQSARAPR
jgi:hypothetical protein